MRAWWAAFVVGCGYPEFAFAPRDSSIDTLVEPQDSSVFDSAMLDTFVAMDTTIADTSVSDTFVVTDTRPETMPDTADTAMPTWCDSMHVFCQDFDMSTAPSDGWSSSFVTGGGTTALDKLRSTSPPNSFLASVPSSTVSSAAMLSKNLTLPTVTTVIRMDARILLDSLTYGGPGDAILFKVQHAPAGDGVSLVVNATGPQLVATGTTTLRWDVTGLTAGTWARVRIEAVMHTTAGSAKIWINDMTAPKVSKTGVTTAATDDTTRQFFVGIFSFMGAAPFKAQFDDVSYDLP